MPQERIACGDRDHPWMNNKVKKLINEKNSGYKSYCHFNRDVFLVEKFKFMHNQLSVSIENSMQRYYSSKLANPATSSKTYWSIFKSFLSNKKLLVYLLCFMKIG